MTESLFVLPEFFDSELLVEVCPYLNDDEIVYVAGDLDDAIVFEEEEAVAIQATWRQVRQYLPRCPTADTTYLVKAPEQCHIPRPKRLTLETLLGRTVCARCRQIGHLSRTCTHDALLAGRQEGIKLDSHPESSADIFEHRSVQLAPTPEEQSGAETVTGTRA